VPPNPISLPQIKELASILDWLARHNSGVGKLGSLPDFSPTSSVEFSVMGIVWNVSDVTGVFE
jgi:hypothetical protein